MNNVNKPSIAAIIGMGYLMINIPVIIIMLFVAFFILLPLGIDYPICIAVGGIVGWVYWWLMIGKWIRWGLKRNIEPIQLHKIGMRSLLLWKRDIIRVEKISAELAKEK